MNNYPGLLFLVRRGASLLVLSSVLEVWPPEAVAGGSAEEVRSAVVELWADVSDVPPRVTLRWNPSGFETTKIEVSRRLRGAGGWGPASELPPGSLSWADEAAAAATAYEYRVTRTQASPAFPVAEGHLVAGSGIPVEEARGGVIVAVEQGIAAPLASEIERFLLDLVGDGWVVRRTDVARDASPSAVRDAIRGWYATSPGTFRAVVLLGRIPVPYSGQIAPDGHDDAPPLAHHRGAWPADAFYGDMDGVWTDSSIDYALGNLGGTRNHNRPGDGKFDVSLLVGEHLPELAVGRIDLWGMEGVAGGLGEVAMLRRYLDRLHAFRHRRPPFADLGGRALVDDKVFGPLWALPAASSGWASGIALFGNSATAAGDWIPALRDGDHLLAFGCGPGSFDGAQGVSSSDDFRDTRCRAVFNLLFGSFFGDWDNPGNFLRAPLAAREDSHGLVSLWSGHPRWQLFPLAAGGTLVEAYRHVVDEVNQAGGPVPPAPESWTHPDQCHVAIMGDPTLRSHPPKPVAGLSAAASGRDVTLSWSLPTGDGDALGCLVYRASSRFGPYERVGPMTAPGASGSLDTVPFPGTWRYMVRAVKRQTTASAVYENPSQGVFAEVLVEEADSFAEWAAGLSEAGEDDDPNGDGVANLLAYALGAPDGTVSATPRLPRGAGGEVSLAFAGRSEILYEMQRSLDLRTWFAVARRPPGGAWAPNAASGYPNQAAISIMESPELRFRDASSPAHGFWRLWVGR